MANILSNLPSIDELRGRSRNVLDRFKAPQLSPLAQPRTQIDPSSTRADLTPSQRFFAGKGGDFLAGIERSFREGDVFSRFKQPEEATTDRPELKFTNASLDIANRLTGIPAQLGTELGDIFKGATTTDFGDPRERLQKIGGIAKKAIVPAATVKGLASPGLTLGITALGGALGAGASVLRGEEDVLKQGLLSATETFGRAPTIAGVTSITNPIISKFTSGLPLITRTLAASGANVIEGILINPLIDRPAFEDILIDALIPVGLEISGASLRPLKEAFKALDLGMFKKVMSTFKSKGIQIDPQVVTAVEDRIRDAQGKFTTLEKLKELTIKDTKGVELKQTGENEFSFEKNNGPIKFSVMGVEQEPLNAMTGNEAFGAFAGFVPQFDEEGNLTGFTFDPTRAAAGVAFAGGVKAVKGADDLLRLPDVSGKRVRAPEITSVEGKDFVIGDLSKPLSKKQSLQKARKIIRKQAREEFAEFSKQARAAEKQSLGRARDAVADITSQIRAQTGSLGSKNVEQIKDISPLARAWTDAFRNFKKAYGPRFPEVKRLILDPFDKSKGDYVDMQDKWARDLHDHVVKKLDIGKGSKKSGLVQLFGEGKISLEQLKQRAPKNWPDIVEADGWFRNAYDTLLDDLNASRAKIYPGNTEKLIPKRDNYYRHFQEFSNDFKGILNIMDTPANISSNLAGVSEFTKPKSKWLGLAQKRTGDLTDLDAVGGFIDWLKSGSYATHIDPHIGKFRALKEELVQATGEGTGKEGSLNNFIEFLDDFSNDLAGKTNPSDRLFTKLGIGRKSLRAINWLNSRVKANVIVGNLSSAWAQIYNIPQGIADVGPKNTLRGAKATLADIFDKSSAIKQSTFVKERYASSIYDKFDTGMLKNTRKLAVWVTGIGDEVGTKLIWNMEFAKAVDEGSKNPIKQADDITRNMVAGRGVGEVPIAQKSKFIQLIAPFQLEVANLWHIMGDFVGEKQFGKLATLFIANRLFNAVGEQVRGSGVVFDPIQAFIEGAGAFQEEQDKKTGAIKFGGRLAGEVLSNVPLGQTLAATYPEYGFKVGETQAPTREDLFGEGDPTRFGSGLLVTKGIQDPLFKLAPAFGGQQIKRTLEGLQTVSKGFSETKGGRVRFPVAQTLKNTIKAATFGQFSLPEARAFFDSGGQPLGDKQSEAFKASGGREQFFQEVTNKREANKIENKAKDRVKGSDSAEVANNKLFYLKEGVVKSINLDFDLEAPKLTGNTLLDKELTKDYKSDITRKINNIVDLVELGYMGADEAEKLISGLQAQKDAVSPAKKGKKAPVLKLKSTAGRLKKIKLGSSITSGGLKLSDVALAPIKVPGLKF